MLETHKVEMKRSRLRTGIMKLVETKNRTPEQDKELDKLNVEYANTEIELRSAMTLNEHSVTPDTGQVAFGKLENRAADIDECWLLKVALGETIDTGPVKEYRDEMELGDDEIDVNLLVERRADVATHGPNAKADASPISLRVFRPTVLSALGIRPEMVSPSERNYPVLTAGTTAGMVGVDTARESTAGGFTVTSLTPKQARGRVTMRTSELAIFPQFEAALRQDLGRQIDDIVSNQVVNGNNLQANINGLASTLTAVNTPTGGVIDFGGFVSALNTMVDGTYAASRKDLRVIIGVQTWQVAAGAQKSDESDMFALDWLTMKAQSISLSPHIGNAPTSGDENKGQRVFATKSRGLVGSFGMPFWRNVSIIRDHYSDAAKGWIHITANLNWNFRITRAANWYRTTVKVVA